MCGACLLYTSESSVEKFRKEFHTEEANNLKNTVGEFLTNIDINPYSVAVDSYVNYFCPQCVSLLDYLEDAVFFIDEPARVEEQLNAVETEFRESMSHRLEKGYVLAGQTDILWQKNEILEKINSRQKILFTTIAQKLKTFQADGFVEVDTRNISPYNSKFEMLVEDLKRYKKQKYAVLLVTSSSTRGRRLAEDLREFQISAFYEEDRERQVAQEEVMIVKGSLRKGFIYPMIKFAAISDTDIFGQRKKKLRRKHGYKAVSYAHLDVYKRQPLLLRRRTQIHLSE